jgi:hypothetical protein
MLKQRRVQREWHMRPVGIMTGGNARRGDGPHLPNGGNTEVGQRGSVTLGGLLGCLAAGLIKPAYHQDSSGEAGGKPRMAGGYTDQRLNLSKLWEGPRKKCQGFKPDPGNPAVRDYRAASGTSAMVGMCTPPAIERVGNGPPTYSVARPISISIANERASQRRTQTSV